MTCVICGRSDEHKTLIDRYYHIECLPGYKEKTKCDGNGCRYYDSSDEEYYHFERHEDVCDLNEWWPKIVNYNDLVSSGYKLTREVKEALLFTYWFLQKQKIPKDLIKIIMPQCISAHGSVADIQNSLELERVPYINNQNFTSRDIYRSADFCLNCGHNEYRLKHYSINCDYKGEIFYPCSSYGFRNCKQDDCCNCSPSNNFNKNDYLNDIGDEL